MGGAVLEIPLQHGGWSRIAATSLDRSTLQKCDLQGSHDVEHHHYGGAQRRSQRLDPRHALDGVGAGLGAALAPRAPGRGVAHQVQQRGDVDAARAGEQPAARRGC